MDPTVTNTKFQTRQPSMVICRAEGAGMIWDVNHMQGAMGQDIVGWPKTSIHMHGYNEPGQQRPKLV